MSIREMMESGLQVSVTVNAVDLKEFALSLIAEGRRMGLAEREEDRSLTLKEAAKRLGVSVNSLWRWEKSGYLVPHLRVGRRPMYSESQIREIMMGKHNK